MFTSQQHLGQAEHNERFAESLDVSTTPYLDWVVTGMFYAALHYVSAYLATRPYTDYDQHYRVTEYLRDDPKLRRHRALRDSYRDLRNDSEEARYRLKTFLSGDVRDLRDVQLRYVRETIRALLP